MEPGPASLPIDGIVVPDGRRTLRGVAELAASIAEVGLIHPITVTPDARLVAGYHRLEACRGLGWAEIAATVVAADDLTAKLIEIDENLRRNEGNPLERGQWLAERKGIYEALHPETRPVTIRGGPGRGHKTSAESALVSAEGQEERAPERRQSAEAAFSQDTASRTGISQRVIQEDIQIAENIAPDVKEAIRDTPIASKKAELLPLARVTPIEQREAVAKVKSGESPSVREAIRFRPAVVADLAPESIPEIRERTKEEDLFGSIIRVTAETRMSPEAVADAACRYNYSTAKHFLTRVDAIAEWERRFVAALRSGVAEPFRVVNQ